MTAHTRERFAREVQAFAQQLTPRDTGARVVALHGDLGSGKTTFVQELAHTLGVHEAVTSPTFVIQKTYSLPRGAFSTLVHIDAYRLDGADALEPLRWETTVRDTSALILIEWAERVSDALPPDTQHITLRVIDATHRDISYGR